MGLRKEEGPVTVQLASSYSRLVLWGFHQIYLPAPWAGIVDRHVWASGHHLVRSREALSRYRIWEFHHRAYLRHVEALTVLIARFGDFTFAIDPSERELHFRHTWRDLGCALPNPQMLDDLQCDQSIALGEQHPYDELFDISSFDIHRKAA